MFIHIYLFFWRSHACVYAYFFLFRFSVFFSIFHANTQGLHQSHTMDGCSAPIVVKFADTQKEKEQKKMQQMQANLWNLAAANINIGSTQAAAQTAPPPTPSIIQNPPQQSSPILAAATESISPASLHLLQQLQAVGLQQQILQGKCIKMRACGFDSLALFLSLASHRICRCLFFPSHCSFS